MRVLMTADTVGGVWTYSMELIEALGTHGIDVILATMGAPPDHNQLMQSRSLSNLELSSSSFKLEWMDDPWDDVDAAGDWLLSIEAETRPDIVHLNGYTHGNLPWNAPVVMVGHSCVLSWWNAVKREIAPNYWDTYKERVSSGLSAADTVAAPTQAMLDALEMNYGPFSVSEVVYNTRNPLLFQPGRKDTYVLSAGRLWDESKNIAALSRAASGVKWPVFVAGDITLPGTDCTKPSEWPNVMLTGKLTPLEMSDWLASASIYALPAKYEPFGLSILEAGLSGCALVLGDIQSLREIWDDAALYVNPNDEAELQQVINMLIDDDDWRIDLSQRARTKALEYSPQRMVQDYIRIYNLLTAGHTKRVGACNQRA